MENVVSIYHRTFKDSVTALLDTNSYLETKLYDIKLSLSDDNQPAVNHPLVELCKDVQTCFRKNLKQQPDLVSVISVHNRPTEYVTLLTYQNLEKVTKGEYEDLITIAFSQLREAICNNSYERLSILEVIDRLKNILKEFPKKIFNSLSVCDVFENYDSSHFNDKNVYFLDDQDFVQILIPVPNEEMIYLDITYEKAKDNARQARTSSE